MTQTATSLIRDRLAALRAAHSGCEAVLLIDIEAQTVLFADSAVRAPQEHLDRLGTIAGEVFRDADPSITRGIVASDLGTRVFLRASDSPNEVLCLVVAPRFAISGIVAAGLTLMVGMRT